MHPLEFRVVDLPEAALHKTAVLVLGSTGRCWSVRGCGSRTGGGWPGRSRTRGGG